MLHAPDRVASWLLRPGSRNRRPEKDQSYYSRHSNSDKRSCGKHLQGSRGQCLLEEARGRQNRVSEGRALGGGRPRIVHMHQGVLLSDAAHQ